MSTIINAGVYAGYRMGLAVPAVEAVSRVPPRDHQQPVANKKAARLQDDDGKTFPDHLEDFGVIIPKR